MWEFKCFELADIFFNINFTYQRHFMLLNTARNVSKYGFFWSVFSCIRTKYGKIPGISPYSVRMRENTDQRKFRISTLFMQRKKSKTYILDMFEYPSECSGSVWYTINHGSHWYYRTNYVEGNWDAMLEQMNKNHTVLFFCPS